MTTLTGQLAEFCTSLYTRPLPAPVLEHTAVVLLEWLGATLAGAPSPSAALVRQLDSLFGGPREASLVGCAQRAPMYLAALHNGTASAVHELDDVHIDAPIHPSVVIIPAALAVAEATRSSPGALLASIAAGYEVMIRIGWMLGPSHYERWHTTSTSGCFGAAAAVGSLLRLDAGKLTAAFGLAGAQAGGVWEGLNREAIMVKHFHGGRAAGAGLMAAYLARTGYPGAPTVLEGERGLLANASRATAADIRTAMASLGQEFMIQTTFFKRHPCCLGNFHGLDAVVSALGRETVAAADIEAVTVHLDSNSAWMVGNPAPSSIFEAKFSLPFAIATYLRAGRLGFQEYDDRWLQDPPTRDLMGRVKLVADDTLGDGVATVEIQRRGAGPLRGHGRWRNLEPSEVEQKFRDVVGGLIGDARTARLATIVKGLPRARSLDELWSVLAETPTVPTQEGARR
jgi:2-methylcitrate dehydratase PrpD